MLPKTTYRKVVKALERLKQQDSQDRKENPTRIPIGWKCSILSSIRFILDEDHVPGNRNRLAEETITYLLDKGILVPYAGDVSFPGNQLPSEKEIRQQALTIIKGL